MSSFTAAGPRRFTRTNRLGVAQLVTPELAGVDGSAVVTAWCDSRPSADFLCGGHDGEGVTNIDIDDSVPANTDGGQWVGNDYTFIKDLNLWTDENQVGATTQYQSPKTSRNGISWGLCEPKRNREHEAKHECASSEEVTASRSKSLSITHVSIIAGEK
ncbi:MAG: hypothetical protein ACKOUD_04220 [Rhodoluna sp.]